MKWFIISDCHIHCRIHCRIQYDIVENVFSEKFRYSTCIRNKVLLLMILQIFVLEIFLLLKYHFSYYIEACRNVNCKILSPLLLYNFAWTSVYYLGFTIINPSLVTLLHSNPNSSAFLCQYTYLYNKIKSYK